MSKKILALVVAVAVLVAVGQPAASASAHKIIDTSSSSAGPTDTPVNIPAADLADMDSIELTGVARTQFLSPTFEDLSSLPGFVDGGYASPDSDTLKILWHGDFGSNAQSIVDAGRARGLSTVITHTAFSEKEVMAKIMLLSSALYKTGFNVWSLKPADNYSRVEISGPELFEPQSVQDRIHEIGDRVMGELAFSIVPWDNTLQEPVSYDARRADTNNFTTGGVIGQDTSGDCTTGLGFQRAGYGDYMVTAAHCMGHVNGIDFVTPAARSVGTSGFLGTLWGASPNNMTRTSPVPLDAGLIYLGSGGSPAGTTMFVGSATTTSTSAIAGFGSMPFNSQLCNSAGGTGTRCYAERTGSGSIECVEASGSTCTGHAEVSTMDSPSGQIMFGGGDSGGPLYTYDVVTGDRTIVGFVQGGFGATVNCGSVNYYPNQQCSKTNGRTTSAVHVVDELPTSFSVSY